ncbi:MAG: MFS transporter [Kineosporiaceae bacterium]
MPAGVLRDVAALARGRGFRRLLAVRLTSQGADGVFQVGLAGLVLFSPERAATPGAVAGLLTLATAPFTIVGPFAGVLLDRWRRRQVLVVANLVRAALVIGLAGLVVSDAVGAWLYVGALACLSVNRFLLAALSAGLPHVVEPEDLVTANAVSPTAGTLAAITGGGLAYGVRTLLGASDGTDAVVLLVAAAIYAGASGLALRLHRDALGPDHLTHGGPPAPGQGLGEAWRRVPAEIGEALAHLRERSQAGLALLVIGALRLGYGIATFATVLISRSWFADPDDLAAGMGLLAAAFAASGVGFATAAVLTPSAARLWGRRGWIVACLVVAAVAELLLVVRLSVPVALVAAFLLALGAQGAKISVDAIVQAEVDDDVRGRVFTFYDIVFNVAFIAAANLGWLLLPDDGYSRPVFAGVVVLYLGAALAYVWASSRARPLRSAGAGVGARA